MIFNNPASTSRFDIVGLAICLLVALGLRFFVISQQSAELTVDRDAYLGIATSVVEGRGYSSPGSTVPTAFRPPLYPLTLSLGFIWFSNAFVVANINLLTGLLTVVLTASLGQQLQLRRWRFLAALLVAIDPLLLQYSPQAMTECLCTFLTALWLRLTITPEPDREENPTRPIRHPIRQLLCGIAFGLLVLGRPTFWAIAGFQSLKWLLTLRSDATADGLTRKLNLQLGILSALGTLIVVAPWVVRNWMIMGVPILTTTHGGYTLLLGNNPVYYEQVASKPWGAVWSEASQQKWLGEIEARMQDQLGPDATEVARDAWQSRLAKTYITSEPGHTAAAALHRIRSLWNTAPQVDPGSSIGRMAVNAVRWFYSIELTTALVGTFVVRIRKNRIQWLPLYFLIVSVQLVHLMYWTNTRMRAPLTPAIALFTAAAIQCLTTKKSSAD